MEVVSEEVGLRVARLALSAEALEGGRSLLARPFSRELSKRSFLNATNTPLADDELSALCSIATELGETDFFVWRIERVPGEAEWLRVPWAGLADFARARIFHHAMLSPAGSWAMVVYASPAFAVFASRPAVFSRFRSGLRGTRLFCLKELDGALLDLHRDGVVWVSELWRHIYGTDLEDPGVTAPPPASTS